MTESIVTLAVVIGLCVGLAWIGWALSQHRLRGQRQQLNLTQRRLDAEWRALEDTRLVRTVFLNARRRMAEEANRYPGPHTRQG